MKEKTITAKIARQKNGAIRKGGDRMKMCENCKHWIPMKELEGKCVLYGLKHCAWSPSEATCDEWEEDDDDDHSR